MRATFARLVSASIAIAILSACSPESDTRTGPDRGILWVRDAAEFDALTIQAYRAASDDLAALIADKSWTALPGQQNYGQLPPAIISTLTKPWLAMPGFRKPSKRRLRTTNSTNGPQMMLLRQFGAPPSSRSLPETRALNCSSSRIDRAKLWLVSMVRARKRLRPSRISSNQEFLLIRTM